MDAPHAPNPANPNAQDQFVDVVQGPTNQAQGLAGQNQAQGPAVQNQDQVQETTMLKLVKMYPYSSHNKQPLYNQFPLV